MLDKPSEIHKLPMMGLFSRAAELLASDCGVVLTSG